MIAKPDHPHANDFLPGHLSFQQLFDFTAISVFVIDKKGRIIYANEFAQTYTGLKTDSLFGKSFFELFHDPLENQMDETSLLDQLEITDHEFFFRSQSGKMRTVLVSSKIYSDGSGTHQTYLLVRDITALKKKDQLSAYLNQAATELGRARETQTALEQISHFIVPKFADWFTVDLLNEGNLKLLLLKHSDPAKIKWAYDYRKAYPPDLDSNNGTAVVIKTGKPGFVPKVTKEMIAATVTDPAQRNMIQEIGLQSVMLVPIFTKDVVSGIVNFISSDQDRLFDETDLEFAQNFANLIGLALENTRLNEAATGEILLRRRSEEKFRFLADAISHKVWTADPGGKATYYNKGWYDYTGVAGFDELKAIIWDTLHPDDRKIAAIEYPKAIRAGKAMEVEQRLKRSDGTFRWHLTRFSPHTDSNDEIILWVGTSTDIHEQKESSLLVAAANDQLSSANNQLGAVNEELQSSNEELAAVNEELAKTNEELVETQANLKRIIEENQMLYRQVKELNEKKDEFIGLASHELKTPLTSINGYLQVLDRMDKNDQSHKFVKRTLQQVNKLTALVNDLLDVSKIEAGKLQLLKETFDMQRVVEDAIEVIHHTNNNYEIVFNTTHGDCKVTADSRRIEQVLLNLLTNAIKYSPGEKQVIIGLDCSEGAVTVSVKDFGVGIPADKRSDIFSRFFRVEDGNPNISGLGIGLYISNEIITRHDGKLWIESNQAKGSTFYFSLPSAHSTAHSR